MFNPEVRKPAQNDQMPSFGREDSAHLWVTHTLCLSLNPSIEAYLFQKGGMYYLKISTITKIGLLIALSVVGAFIRIPSPVGTLAFDAVPGFYAALVISPITGAIVAGIGHAATAVINGMPLGLPIHTLISLGMMTAAFATGSLAKQHKIWGCVVGVNINGIALPALLILIPGFGLPFFVASVVSILVASILNMAVAYALFNVEILRKMLNVQ